MRTTLRPILRALSTATGIWLVAAAAVSYPAYGQQAQPTVQPCKTFLSQGFLETRRARFPEALEAFEAASAGAGCAVEAQLGFAEAYNGLNRHKQALEAAHKVLATADDPEILSLAHYQIGLAHDTRGPRMNKKKVAAEDAFRKSLELSEGTHIDSVRALMRIYKETHRQDELQELEQRYPDHQVATRAEQRRKLRGSKPSAPADGAKEGAGAEQEALQPTWPSIVGTIFSCENFASLTPEEIKELLGPPPERPEGAEFTPPKKIVSPDPPYTEEARRAGIEGTIVFQAYVDEEGEVLMIRLTQGLPHGLEEETVKTVCGWVFQPAELGDKRTTSIVNATIGFHLR